MLDFKSRFFSEDECVFVGADGKKIVIFEFLYIFNQKFIWLLNKNDVCIALL
jgi:hypothetical protein